ncbi:hypothetical protein IWQ60_002718 [Tieghemiomyces parasiticus]|uniref:Sulfite oxidase n=1 Tax=Tieghemiomyces parasiticus TaxID=78921 RepID=A0A9W8AC55_9FUNG|nr:hypothetical protein IWQ60_002718 [Tieghemiomyces parasiticus]
MSPAPEGPRRFASVAEQDAYYKSLAPTFNYDDEPADSRDRSVFLVRNELPFNAEPELPALIQHMVTPTERFFKRNHGPIPNISADEYSLTVEVAGDGGVRKVWTLAELQSRFRHYEVMAALQCAGNRRDGLNRVKKVKGVIWGPGTISNAVWSGVFLREVLAASGVPTDPTHPMAQTWHVDFSAYGLCVEDASYGSSIPLQTALDPTQDVLLAFGMNGRPLPRDHGYPCRVVVPGIIGARSVKWLQTIRIIPEESHSFFQKRDYKILPPEANATNLADYWDGISALQQMNIQSVVCEPYEGRPAPPENTPYRVTGYAISGGGARVDRVDVSLDNGRTWVPTTLTRPCSSSAARLRPQDRDLPTTKHWAWTLWQVVVPQIPRDAVVVCRAWDANGNTQPEFPVWNYRGVMNNCWFRVDMKKCLPARKESKAQAAQL